MAGVFSYFFSFFKYYFSPFRMAFPKQTNAFRLLSPSLISPSLWQIQSCKESEQIENLTSDLLGEKSCKTFCLFLLLFLFSFFILLYLVEGTWTGGESPFQSCGAEHSRFYQQQQWCPVTPIVAR